MESSKLVITGKIRTSTLKHARDRAKKAGVEFNVSQDDLIVPEYCPVLGIKLNLSGPMDSLPSIDRLIPALGYTKGNVHVISYKANRLKSDATPSELRQVADYLERKINNDHSDQR